MPQPTAPLNYSGLDHVVLRCQNLDSMLHFYQHVLGCTLERVNGSLHHLRAGTALIDLIPATEPSTAHNMDHYCLRIHGPDWETIKGHLGEHGITMPPPQNRYGADGVGLSVYLQDPEGNQLELKGPPAES